MNDSSAKHVRTANLFTAVVLLLLALLFILPHRQVRALQNALRPYAESATEAVVREDWEKAREYTGEMLRLYQPYDNSLRLYMDHEDVDQLQTRVRSCYNLARAEDEQIIVDLEDVKSGLKYLESIETFSLWNLF